MVIFITVPTNRYCVGILLTMTIIANSPTIPENTSVHYIPIVVNWPKTNMKPLKIF